MPKQTCVTVGLFWAGLTFYLYTLAPSVNWADGARLQLDVMLGGSTYWFFDEARQVPTDGWPFDRLGVAAWDHPLYVMLGQLFLLLPWGEPPFRLNLMSALMAALTIALMYRLGWLLTADHWAALLGAVALAVSHTFWFHAVTTEVYTLNTVFMVSLIWLALRWPDSQRWPELALFAFLSGLGLANHLMLGVTALLAVIYMVMTTTAIATPSSTPSGFWLKSYTILTEAWRGWRSVVLIGLFLLGFAPWWLQFIRMAKIIGVPLTLEIGFGFPWLGRRLLVESLGAASANLSKYFGWLLYQFTPVGVGLGLYGFWHMRRTQPAIARFLLALFIVHVVYSANYALADQFTFHLSSYLVFALAITWSIVTVTSRSDHCLLAGRKWSTVGLRGLLLLALLLPIALYAITPPALRAVGVTESKLGVQPIGMGLRDTLTYFLNPNKRGDDSAARFGRSTLSQLAPNALVFTPKPSDQEAYVVLRYFQLVERLRPDVRLDLMLFGAGDNLPQAVLAQVHTQIACRPLYLASLHPDTYPLEKLQAEFDLVPEANLYRLVPRHPQRSVVACPELKREWASVTLEQLIRRAMRWP